MAQPLTVRTAPIAGRRVVQLLIGDVCLVGGILLLAFKGGDGLVYLAPGIALLVGGLFVTLEAVRSMLSCPVYKFDAKEKTITRKKGMLSSSAESVGRFEDFTGVDLVTQIAMPDEGASVHETYPSMKVQSFDVVLTGKTRQFITNVTSKKSGKALQDSIVEYCGWSHRGSSVPDSRRRLDE